MRITSTDNREAARKTGYNRLSRYCQNGFATARQPVRVGLALGGGGAKGTIHVGVIKALIEAGIQIDIVTGTSVGGYVGLQYCAGSSVKQMVELVKNDFVISPFWRWVPGGLCFRLSRLLGSGHIERTIQRDIRFERIEELPKRFAVTATDLISGKSVCFSRGSIAKAVKASMNVPGLSRPIEHDGMLLVDGGILQNLPVPAAKACGADIVIAVDISGDSLPFCRSSSGSLRQAMNRSLALQRQNLHEQLTELADVLIQPDVRGLKMADFSVDPDMLVEIGEVAAKKALHRIRAIVSKEQIRRNATTRFGSLDQTQ